MSTRQMIIIIVIAIAAAIIIAFLAAGGGPRVTQITRTVKREDEKDGDDA